MAEVCNNKQFLSTKPYLEQLLGKQIIIAKARCFVPSHTYPAPHRQLQPEPRHSCKSYGIEGRAVADSRTQFYICTLMVARACVCV